MKVINPETGFLAYQKMFSHMQANQTPLVIWQVRGEKRVVSETVLTSYHLDSKLLYVSHTSSMEFTESLPLYCYVEDGLIIFKTSLNEVKGANLCMALPTEIKLLELSEVEVIRGQLGHDLSDVWKVKRLNFDRDDGSDIMRVKSMAQRTSRDQEFLNNEFNPVSLDEEDRMFADKRESPRARPKVDKYVFIRIDGLEQIHRVKLFDLSQGGMGFLVFDTEKFPKGSRVEVVGFDEFNLDDPLFGKVMSHRETDETKVEWKVGVKFDEGQA